MVNGTKMPFSDDFFRRFCKKILAFMCFIINLL